MRALLIPLLILLCLALAFFYVLVNTPFAMNAFLPDFINEKNTGVVLEEFHCVRQKGRLPKVLSMYDVTMKFRQGNEVYQMTADEIAVQNFFEFLRSQKLLRMASRGITLKNKDVTVHEGQFKGVIHFREGRLAFMETMIFAKEFMFGPYVFADVTAHLKGNSTKVEIYDVEGDGYGGKVSGQISFDRVPEFNYVLWAELEDIEAGKMDRIYPMFFNEIQGKFGGSIRFVGGKEVDIFTVILSAQPGMKISPGLFFHVNDIFDDVEKAELRRLKNAGSSLVVQSATMHIQNARAGQIMLIFNIEEAKNHFMLKGRVPLDWPQQLETFLFPHSNQ